MAIALAGILLLRLREHGVEVLVAVVAGIGSSFALTQTGLVVAPGGLETSKG